MNEYTAEVQEGTSASVFVVQVLAVDIDSPGNNSDIDFSIIDGDSMGYFALGKKNGLVTVNRGDIDREQTPLFNITVQAEDNGTPSMNTTVQLFITITDVHDEPPVFTQAAFYGEITEGSGNDRPVYVNGTMTQLFVSASDPDENAVVTITAYGANPFSVNSKTGAVTLSKAVDFEDESNYEFVCTASDGEGGNTAPVPVYITVINKDDNVPVFDEASYSPSVPEDTQLGEEILAITAQDADGDAIMFKINPTNRILCY